uniref:Uncharacterized protein n=2 Tax=Cacopsylla melanoneura TaxID=428564 RepID=A0A8D8Y574_9HEMI
MSEKAAADVLKLNRNIENEHHTVAVKPTCHAGVAPLLDISNSEMMNEPIAPSNPTKTSMKRPPSDDEESVEVGTVKKIKLLDQDVINEKIVAISNDVLNLLENDNAVNKVKIEDSRSCNGHVKVESKCDENSVEATDENVKCENKSDLNGETTIKTEDDDETLSNVEKVNSLQDTPESSTTEVPYSDTCIRLPDDNESNVNAEKAAICDKSNLNSSVNFTASVHHTNTDNNTNTTKTDQPTVPHCESSSQEGAESKLNSIQSTPSECNDLNSPNAQSLLLSHSNSNSSLSNGNTSEPKTDLVSETKDNLQTEEKTSKTNVDNTDLFEEGDFDDIQCLESTLNTHILLCEFHGTSGDTSNTQHSHIMVGEVLRVFMEIPKKCHYPC